MTTMPNTLWDTIKALKPKIWTKGRENVFNESIADNFPHLGREKDIQTHEARHDQKRTSPHHLIV
jgi:hypothetical protein